MEQKRGPVSFTSSPGITARVGKVYLYTVTAAQQDALPGDAITYSLMVGPAGMNVHAQTGEVTWVPEPGQEGQHSVAIKAEGHNDESALQEYTLDVFHALTIESIHPAAGSAQGGEVIAIKGTGFVGNIGVLFGTLAATNVIVVNDNTLSVTTPPAIAGTRRVNLTLGGTIEASFTPGFTHLPSIARTDTTATLLSSNLTIYGTGFHQDAVNANVLTVASRGGTDRRIIASEATSGSELVYTLGVGNAESSLTTGAVAVLVHGFRTNWVPLTITDATLPAELAVTGTDGPHTPGEDITLHGAGFAGLTPANLSVKFSGSAAPATVVSIPTSGKLVVVTVPADAVTGPIALSALGRLPAKSFEPAVVIGTTPTLDVVDFTPEGGLPGSALVLRGTGFVPDSRANTVTFDGIVARVLSAETTRLVVEVPFLKFGPADIQVRASGKSVSAGTFSVVGPFEIISGGGPTPPVIGDGGPPTAAMLGGSFVTVDASGNYFIADGDRVRAINNGTQPATLYGVNVMPGTIQTITDVGSVSALAVHPVTQDLFVANGPRIYQITRAGGAMNLYAGARSPGNGGNGGTRLNASFNGISDLAFTSGGVLVIADNNNSAIRAINTTGTSVSLWGLNLGPEVVEQIVDSPLANPIGVALDAQDSIYATTFQQIRKIAWNRPPPSAPGYVAFTTIAGTGASLPEEGCPASAKSLGVNDSIVIDPVTGDAFVGSRHGLIRRIKASGGSSAQIDADDCVEFVAGRWRTGKALPDVGYAAGLIRDRQDAGRRPE